LNRYIIGAVAIALIALAWWYGQRPVIPAVPFAKVTRETLVSSLPTNGKVEPIEWTAIRAAAPGLVERVSVQEGQRVRQGETIATLRAPEVQADLAAAEAQIARARAQLTEIERGGQSAALAEIESGLQRARFQKQTAEQDLAALTRLLEKKAATQAEVDAARQRVNAAQIEIDALTRKRAALTGATDRSVAEAQLKEGQAALEAARRRQAQSEVRSTVSGVAYNVGVRPGAYVNTGDPIASVGRLDTLRVRVFVDEPELGRVAPGQPVKITWDALPGASWTGTVEKIPTEITPLGTRQVGEVLCTIENTNGRLVSGANVNVEIQTSVAQNALTVPKEAIRRQGSQTGAFVLEGDRIHWREVQIGVSSATRSQVTSGLKEGDPVALTVDFQLQDGDRVEPTFP
jgi:HlyD family secretion protein